MHYINQNKVYSNALCCSRNKLAAAVVAGDTAIGQLGLAANEKPKGSSDHNREVLQRKQRKGKNEYVLIKYIDHNILLN